jgi:hypothetical protein
MTLEWEGQRTKAVKTVVETVDVLVYRHPVSPRE